MCGASRRRVQSQEELVEKSVATRTAGVPMGLHTIRKPPSHSRRGRRAHEELRREGVMAAATYVLTDRIHPVGTPRHTSSPRRDIAVFIVGAVGASRGNYLYYLVPCTVCILCPRPHVKAGGGRHGADICACSSSRWLHRIISIYYLVHPVQGAFQPIISLPELFAGRSVASSFKIHAPTGQQSAAVGPMTTLMQTLPTAVLPMSTRAAGVAIEGKSLFTCSQCGSLLKFRANTTPIKDRVALLRNIPIEAQDVVCSADGAGIQQPAVISELVWENQQRPAWQDGHDGEEQTREWTPAAFDIAAGLAPFVSANRGELGMTLEETIPNRLLSKAHLWLSETWEVDTSFPECDSDGWIYLCSDGDGSSVENAEDGVLPLELEDDTPPREATLRRRRYVRKRQTDGSDLSWFQELLDCSSLLLQKKTPSCHDCELGIIQNLQQTLNGLESAHQQYEAFLSDFPVTDDATNSSGAIDDEIHALEEEERRLQAELSSLEAEAVHLASRRRDLWSTGTDLEHLIRGTFAEGAFLQHLLGLSRDERQSVGVFSVHASDMLRRLQRYNVCNDVFHIWHDGLFGTINGLRLGRLPTRPVEWVEINAALGQAVLLLATIADRAQFDFTRNKLIPRGSYSRVVNMYGKEYSLYSDGGMFRRRGFNQAMVLFLECVDDAGKRAMREEPSLKFPYKIQRGKIGDLPISLGNDEQWTKALKYMLTHLKWLLAWVAKKYP